MFTEKNLLLSEGKRRETNISKRAIKVRKVYKTWLGNGVVKRIQKRGMTTVCKYLKDVKVGGVKICGIPEGLIRTNWKNLRKEKMLSVSRKTY